MEEEVDLREYINVMLKWKWLIIWITILAMLFAGIFSYFIATPVYEAEGALVVSPNNAHVSISNPQQLLNPLTFLPQISVSSYINMIKSHTVEERVLSDLNLDKPPYNMTIDKLNQIISVNNPKNSTILNVSVEYTDPKIAERIVSTLLEESVNFANSINNASLSKGTKGLENQLKIAKQQLEAAQEALAQFNSQKDNISNLSAKRASYANALSSYRSQILSLDYQIEQYKEQLATTESQLKQVKKFFIVEKSILDEPLLAKLAEELSNANIIELSQLKVNSQEINPVYEDLLSKKSNYSITLAGLTSKEESLTSLINSTVEKIHQLDEEINDKQLELDKLNRKLYLAKKYYDSISSNYQQALIANKSMFSPILILDKPVVPTHPVKPKKMFNIAVAGVAAFFFAILLAFFLEYWQSGDDKSKLAESSK